MHQGYWTVSSIPPNRGYLLLELMGIFISTATESGTLNAVGQDASAIWTGILTTTSGNSIHVRRFAVSVVVHEHDAS